MFIIGRISYTPVYRDLFLFVKLALRGARSRDGFEQMCMSSLLRNPCQIYKKSRI